MAIVKVGTYRNPPEDITDYEAIVAHLSAFTRQIAENPMILTEWINATTLPKIALGSYISHGGVLYIIDTEDYEVAAPVADGIYYLRLVASGETLAVDFVSDISGYVWNPIYNGMYNSGYQILPYQIAVAGASIKKYKIIGGLWYTDKFTAVDYLGNVYVGNNLSVAGVVTCASVDTGQGANELYAMNQNMRTTDEVEFASVNDTKLINCPRRAVLLSNSVVASKTGAEMYAILNPYVPKDDAIYTAYGDIRWNVGTGEQNSPVLGISSSSTEDKITLYVGSGFGNATFTPSGGNTMIYHMIVI